jgi:hypothetical protein
VEAAPHPSDNTHSNASSAAATENQNPCATRKSPVQNSKQNLQIITTTTRVTRTRGPTKPHARKENRKNEAARDHHRPPKPRKQKLHQTRRQPEKENENQSTSRKQMKHNENGNNIAPKTKRKIKTVEGKPENRKTKSRSVQHKTKNSGRTAKTKHINTRRTNHRNTEQKTKGWKIDRRRKCNVGDTPAKLSVVTRNHKASSHHQDYGSTSLTAGFEFWAEVPVVCGGCLERR